MKTDSAPSAPAPSRRRQSQDPSATGKYRSCKICQSPLRPAIESLLRKRVPFVAIYRFGVEHGERFYNSTIYAHRDKHMPAEDANRLHGELANKALEQVSLAQLKDHAFMLESIVENVNKQLVSGTLNPTVADGIKAAELIVRGKPSNPITDAFIAMFMKASG